MAYPNSIVHSSTLTEQICQLLEQRQVDHIRVIGWQHNDYAYENVHG